MVRGPRGESQTPGARWQERRWIFLPATLEVHFPGCKILADATVEKAASWSVRTAAA